MPFKMRLNLFPLEKYSRESFRVFVYFGMVKIIEMCGGGSGWPRKNYLFDYYQEITNDEVDDTYAQCFYFHGK